MKVGIVGGGITGLTAAWQLCQKGNKVTLFEKSAELGGLLSSFEINHRPIEKYYHHIFYGDEEIKKLISHLGLQDRLMWLPASSAVMWQGQAYPLNTPADLLRFKPLSVIDRVRFGRMLWQASRVKEWKNLDRLTAQDWIIKTAGPRVFEKVWQPLLVSKFDKDAPEISAAWFWHKVKIRSTSRASSKPVLGYLEGGFHQIVDRLKEEILKDEGEILVNHKVQQIIGKKSVEGLIANHQKFQFDVVVLTLPDSSQIIIDNLPVSLQKKISKIKYKANLCLVLELKQTLSPHYWLTINDPGIPFVAVIEHTNFVDKSYYGQHRIVYLSRYLGADDPLFHNPAKSSRVFLEGLKKIFPGFRDEMIYSQNLFRTHWAQPVATKNYLKIIPGFETGKRGLYLANMSQIYPQDRGINYAVDLGNKVAQLVVESGQK